MKRIFIAVLAALCVAALSAALVACGGAVTVSLSETSLSMTVGDTQTLVATVSDGSTVTWSSSDEDVATVSSRGAVSAQGAGTATITAASGDAIATCTVTVEAKETVTISGLDATATVDRGDTIELSATASDGSAITWSSSDTQVATVEGGTVTGVFPGEATIIATTASGARAQCAVTVTYDDQPAGWYEIQFYEQNKVPQNTWGYWNDQNWNGSQVTMTAKPEYLGDSADSEAGSATFSFTATGHCTYGMQITYRTLDVEYGKYYTLDCVIDVDVDCVITVNGNRVELKAGSNDVSVKFLCDDNGEIYPTGNYTNLSSAVFIQMGSAVDDTMVEAATITISQLHWTEYTPEALAAPTLSVSGTSASVSDPNEADHVSGYEIGFFEGDTLVYLLPVAKDEAGGVTIDDSKFEDGTYTLRVRALAEGIEYAASAWSDGGASWTVDNGGVSYAIEYRENAEADAVADPYTWYYWSADYAEGGENNPNVTYDNGTVTLEVTSNAGEWYATQLFYRNATLTSGQAYTLTMKITSDATGSITVNGTVVELTAGQTTEVSIGVTGGSGSSVSIQLGTADGGIDIASGTLVIADIAWTPVA